MKTKAMLKYISIYLLKNWVVVAVGVALFGILLGWSDFRSSRRDMDELIDEYGTYEQIPEDELDNVDGFSASFGMMYVVIVSISSSALAIHLFGLTMQMSTTRKVMRRVYFAAMAELSLIGGVFFWIAQTAAYRFFASKAESYPVLRDACLNYSSPKYLCFFLFTGFATAAVGAFFSILLSKSKLAAGVLAITMFTGTVVGTIMLYFYAGTLAATLTSIGVGALFALLSSNAIMNMSLESNLFKPARR